jgi:hypothetical protein
VHYFFSVVLYIQLRHLFFFGTSLQAESPLDSFLSSLGLEKYSITFQAEEV